MKSVKKIMNFVFATTSLTIISSCHKDRYADIQQVEDKKIILSREELRDFAVRLTETPTRESLDVYLRLYSDNAVIVKKSEDGDSYALSRNRYEEDIEKQKDYLDLFLVKIKSNIERVYVLYPDIGVVTIKREQHGGRDSKVSSSTVIYCIKKVNGILRITHRISN